MQILQIKFNLLKTVNSYILIFTEKGNKNPDDVRKEFIYCTDIDADYELHTGFTAGNGGQV